MFLSASFSGRVEQQFKNFVSMICDMELCKEIPSSSFFFLHGVQRLFFGAEEEDWLSPTLRPSKSSMDRKKPSRRREIPWTLFTLHLPTLRCLSSFSSSSRWALRFWQAKNPCKATFRCHAARYGSTHVRLP
jgi:hypothetical protein